MIDRLYSGSVVLGFGDGKRNWCREVPGVFGIDSEGPEDRL